MWCGCLRIHDIVGVWNSKRFQPDQDTTVDVLLGKTEVSFENVTRTGSGGVEIVWEKDLCPSRR